MCVVSFKERVKNEAISNAYLYEENYIQYEYLVCSEAFETSYHVIKCDKGNYLHLIGIHTELSAEDFFDKCIAEELLEEYSVKSNPSALPSSDIPKERILSVYGRFD